MSPEFIVLLMFVGLFIGIFFGYPTAFVLGGLAMIFGVLFSGLEVFGFFKGFSVHCISFWVDSGVAWVSALLPFQPFLPLPQVLWAHQK